MKTMSEIKRMESRGWVIVGKTWYPRMTRRPSDERSTNFNAYIDDPDGAVQSSTGEANADILSGRVKSFSSAEDLIASLKKPW